MGETAAANDLESWLRLAFAPEIGLKLAHLLLRRFGSPDRIFSATRRELMAVDGIGDKRLEGLLSPSALDAAQSELRLAGEHEVRILTPACDDYPRNLSVLESPPLALYVKGALLPQDSLALAVVGPRNPSQYARLMTGSLVPPLCARGLTIVSGLAAGIDAEAHHAAIDCGGRTIAVLGHGLDVPIYPATNRNLAVRMIREGRGAIVSVFPFETKPEAGNFPKRNEIIAALSIGALIVEASETSGALITASHAAEFGRTVMACPGDATRPNARGANKLIADGAALIQRSDDVLAVLADDLARLRGEMHQNGESIDEPSLGSSHDDSAQNSNRQRERPSEELEGRIWDLLEDEHRPIDYILDQCAGAGYSHSEVVHKLLMMEMGGTVAQLPGRIFALAP